MQSRLDGFVNAVVLATTPLWFYVAVHWTALLKWEHFWSVLILAAGPWCLMALFQGGCHLLLGCLCNWSAVRISLQDGRPCSMRCAKMETMVIPLFAETT